MAGLLYLYRLFVYHAERGLADQKTHELLSLMEWRLLTFITRPAMLVTWIAGLGMIFVNPAIAGGGWFGLKFILVLLMTFVSEKAGAYRKKFQKFALTDPSLENIPSGKFFRVLNEVPTILMLVIVALVVFKPF